MIKLVLASQSPGRRAVLTRLGFYFDAFNPDIIEEMQINETPVEYVQRLSLEKAIKVRSMLPEGYSDGCDDVWILGNDQTGVCNGKIYEKPETLEKGVEFFREMSGQEVIYYSGMTLLSLKTGKSQTSFSKSMAKMLPFHEGNVRKYFELCPSALQAASGLKIESCGAFLVESIMVTDPYAGPGLPVFLLRQFLENWGGSPFYFCEKPQK